ncbi:Uncharacterised protein [Mycobacteroides abscessus subsp. abscessus]|nr:Uncharacterised protein [Mycobacteroides abscessus subsp. abscessus]
MEQVLLPYHFIQISRTHTDGKRTTATPGIKLLSVIRFWFRHIK